MASRKLACALLVGAFAALAVAPEAGARPLPRGHADHDASARRGDVVANLWEWNWKSVANECRDVLGPAGYGAVQVAPPQDSLSRSGPPPVHPWWEVYQPVDYNLTSRMGDEAQFRSMVATCRRAGVAGVVGAGPNHQNGPGGKAFGGGAYN